MKRGRLFAPGLDKVVVVGIRIEEITGKSIPDPAKPKRKVVASVKPTKGAVMQNKVVIHYADGRVRKALQLIFPQQAKLSILPWTPLRAQGR